MSNILMQDLSSNNKYIPLQEKVLHPQCNLSKSIISKVYL